MKKKYKEASFDVSSNSLASLLSQTSKLVHSSLHLVTRVYLIAARTLNHIQRYSFLYCHLHDDKLTGALWLETTLPGIV